MAIARLSRPGPPVANPRLRLVLIVTVVLAVWLYVQAAAATLRAIGAGLAAGNFYERSDFTAAIWRAGVMLRRGQVAALYHAAWLYPPPMGLLVAPVSLLPLPVAFWLWLGGTNLLAAFLLRRAGLKWWVIGAGLGGPAAFYNVLLGQNGALTAGLLVASVLGLRRRPGFAGGLAGFLCVKAQLGALLPVVLLANGRWRPVLACAGVAAVLAGAAAAAFGWRAWWWFLAVAQPEAHRQLVAPYGAEFQLADYSVFMMARSLGFGVADAWAAQGISAAGASLCVWTLWRQPEVDAVRRAFLTVCCTMLATPFGFSYDLIGFSVVVAAMLPRAPPGRWPVLIALWLWPGVTILIAMETHLVLLPLAAVAGIVLAWRLPPGALTVPALTMETGLANARRSFH